MSIQNYIKKYIQKNKNDQDPNINQNNIRTIDLNLCLKIANNYLKYERNSLLKEQCNQDYITGYMNAIALNFTGPATGLILNNNNELELAKGYSEENVESKFDLDMDHGKFYIGFKAKY